APARGRAVSALRHHDRGRPLQGLRHVLLPERPDGRPRAEGPPAVATAQVTLLPARGARGGEGGREAGGRADRVGEPATCRSPRAPRARASRPPETGDGWRPAPRPPAAPRCPEG